MNTREKFLETMNFKKVETVKWEFGFWGKTIDKWYSEGLPEKRYPLIPTNIINTTSSLYTSVWIHEWKKNKNLFEKIYNTNNGRIPLPKGIGVMSGGLYWPTQGFPLDFDVQQYFNLDKCQIIVNIEQFIYPNFEAKVLCENKNYIDYIDIDGCTRRYSKEQQVLPAGIDWLVKDWDSWNVIKEQRMNVDNIKSRLPNNWKELIKEYKNRDYPLAVGGYPNGLFGTLTHLIGYEKLFYFFHDKPDLIKDILDTITDTWINLWEEVMESVEIDLCNLWEDISSGTGSMISPSTFKEFLLPYYKKISKFLKSKKINIFMVDTDGRCEDLIPLFIDGGVTGLYPIEASAGMDIVKVRKKYPKLQIMGGIPKLEIALGEKKIDDILEPVKIVLKDGGYIPFGDHLIPPEISWENFEYYRNRLNEIIEAKQ